MTQDEIGGVLASLKGGSRLVLTGPRSETDREMVVITWLGYGQLLREERMACETTGRVEATRAYAIDDVALRVMLGARELRPGRPIETVTIST